MLGAGSATQFSTAVSVNSVRTSHTFARTTAQSTLSSCARSSVVAARLPTRPRDFLPVPLRFGMSTTTAAAIAGWLMRTLPPLRFA